MRKKRSLTLLEIMIVIFLITLITGAIGYNMRGTLDRGRAFRTVQAKEQLQDLLLMCVEEGDKGNDIAKDPKRYLDKYRLAKNSGKLIQDGWGNDFDIEYKGGEFVIKSKIHDKYQEDQKK
ncbi:MAG TPA: type II secretion system protein [Chlamydiales bacterium]|nr:MAG: hypothetical protein A3F67_11115 [Verrucomicrobia bacterium RIFCSPHIGHO2_12_FULL_41_10]HLB53110.1 type II secretion system protein [Chlamydiales bacterium]